MSPNSDIDLGNRLPEEERHDGATRPQAQAGGGGAPPAANAPTQSTTRGLLSSLAEVPWAITIGSMAITAVWFAWMTQTSLMVGIGLVLAILVHELGHVLVLRICKVSASVPVFLPFIGAIISLKEEPKSAAEEAWIGMAGPIAGAFASAVALGLHFLTGSTELLWIAAFAFGMNLFNLIPLSPLDGGHVVGGIWRGFWLIGLLAAASLTALSGGFVLMLATYIGVCEIHRKLFSVKAWGWLLLSLFLAFCFLFHGSDPQAGYFLWALGILPVYLSAKRAVAAFSTRSLLVKISATPAGKDPFAHFLDCLNHHRELRPALNKKTALIWLALWQLLSQRNWSNFPVIVRPGEELSPEVRFEEGPPALAHSGQPIATADSTGDSRRLTELVIETPGAVPVNLTLSNGNYFRVPLWHRLLIAGTYVVLCFVLLHSFVLCVELLAPMMAETLR